MSQQPDIDIESRFIGHKRQQFRRQTSQLSGLRCPDCSDGPYATEEDLWNHISSKHPQDIPLDEVGAIEFRELKIQNSKALSPNAHIHWETRTANRKKDVMPDTISSPAGSQSFSRQDVTDTKDPGNCSPKRSAPESTEVNSLRNRAQPHAKRTRGVPKSNTRQNSVDPDFNRSLPIAKEQPDETHPPIQRRLFDPNIDDARTFNANPMQNASGEPVPRSLTAQGMDIRDGPEQRIQQPQPRRPPITIAQRRGPSKPGGSNLDEASVPESPPPKGSPNPPDDESDARLAVIREPITRPISPDQLVAEVKGIYAGLIMVERKCCEVDNRQHQAALRMEDKPLNIQQWQALIALHRTLLHEHHDFLLASQHPSAAPALKRLAQKYAMPARMWRHAIHSFLELLRHRLPASMEHMLTFIYMSYSMMTLLYETVPTFRDTWIECLGDLARYRMAIEDERKKDNHRDVWKNVARQWYSMAADRTPEVGRLYHHLAILARSSILPARLNILSEIFYYCKSLSVGQPFTAARESILTVFDPISQPEMIVFRNQLLEELFVQLHKMGFTQIGLERFEDTLEQFISLLDKAHTEKQSGRGLSRWRTQACFMAVCNIAGLFQYGSRGNILRKTCKEGRKHKNEQASTVQSSGLNSGSVEEDCVIDGSGSKSTEGATEELEQKYDREASLEFVGAPFDTPQSKEVSMGFSKRLALKVLELVLEQLGEPSPHVYAFLLFVLYLADSGAMFLIENEFPWESLVDNINHLRRECKGTAVEGEEFPVADRPLPEDYHLRGLEWSRTFLPDGYFKAVEVDPEERPLELDGMVELRRQRICWLGARLASSQGEYLVYDAAAQQCTVHPTLLARIQQWKEKQAVELKQPEVSIYDEDDVEMSAAPYSEDEGYVFVPEPLRKLKQQKRELEAQLALNAGSAITSPKSTGKSRSSKIKGVESLKRGYTAFVTDTNLLVSNPETFNRIVEEKFAIIVPNCVIIELNGLKQNPNTRGAATKAEETVAVAIAERHDVKIITAMGSDVTGKGPYKEIIKREDGESNIDDVISRTAKAQFDLRLKNLGPSGTAEPVFLVTDDTNLRVKARARGLAAISAKALRQYLDRHQVDHGVQKRENVSRGPISVEPHIKQDDEIEDDLPMIDIAPPEPKQLVSRRRNRRSRTYQQSSFA